MSSNEIAIRITNLSKCYAIYSTPGDRLKQFALPRIQKLFGLRLKKYYREFWALKDVSFEIKKGETVGIIGRNGSGKSTLLQMICGTLTPTTGSIQTNGRIAALLELGSGFNPEFSGRENVYMNAAVLGLSNEEIDTRFNDIVAFADIGDFIDQAVKTYSSGMMVRLAFSVIAHVDADILVVDEALAVGDAFFTQKCMRFLRDFMKNGTVLFVSHDTGSIKGLCSDVIWLEKGKIIHEGEPKHVCELYLEAFYEAQLGKDKGSKNEKKSVKKIDELSLYKDQRMAFINASNLRNDLQIFKFDMDAPSFGKGGAKIHNVQLLNEDQEPMGWVVGGEMVKLKIDISVYQFLNSPIVGFSVKDRLGQVLFGDNTFLSYRGHGITIKAGDEIQANFVFIMPLLPIGEYSIAVAVADGTQETHEQHHWVHDAIVFKSESSSVSTGLVGIPMLDVNLQIMTVPS